MTDHDRVAKRRQVGYQGTPGHTCRHFAAPEIRLLCFPGTRVPGYRKPSLRD
ncbi:MAG: hypothetical protein O3C40_33650 [Planctomycetota bacterium]|nr:hypothetical protein [Planctomycetota bacterium]